MNPNDLDDLDFSSMFEGLTDKLGADTAPFLSKENQNLRIDLRERLYMKLLDHYEDTILDYLQERNNTNLYDVLELQETLIKHQSI